MGSRQVAVAGTPQESHAVRSKADNFQHEHDKFLEDFEKPTVIYRLIRATFLANPRFLYRNLSYMKNRVPRPHNPNRKFSSIDSLLQQKTKLLEDQRVKSILTKNLNFLNIIVIGFYDGQTWLSNTEAKVDIQVIKICGNKRKESQVSLNKSFSASCRIPVKTQTEEETYKDFSISIQKGKYPVLSIPKDSFNIINGHIVQSIRLAVRVAIPASKLVSKTETTTAKQDLVNGNENIELQDKSSSCKGNGRVSLPGGGGHGVSLRKTNGAAEFPDDNKTKRQRSLPTKDRENFVYDDPQKNGKSKANDSVVYVGVLTVYDRDTNINIPDEGNSDLEMRLNRQDQKKTIAQKRAKRENSWEVSLQPDHARIKEYEYGLRNRPGWGSAKIVMAIRSSTDKLPSHVTTVDRVDPVKPSPVIKADLDDEKDEMEVVRVVYYFVRGTGPRQSTPRQTTECRNDSVTGISKRNDLRCPWCSINCVILYSLLKHLEVCHPRFKFTFSRIANGARIDVAINESFDGSYTGSAYDLVAQPPGQAFGRSVPPGKRTQLFCMLAFRPRKMKREKNSLREFFDNEDKNADQNRSYMIGHNRLYHHTTTCLPIHPREIDVDSEGEPDPEWLKVKTCMMIDEFTDVNEGEKEIMKMWNHHVMHENYVGDCQIPLACKKFVERYGYKVIQKNLYRNFVLHLTNLYDFGLLPAQSFHETVQALHGQMKENNSSNALRDSWSSSNTLLASINFTAALSTPSSIAMIGGEPMDVDVSSTYRNGIIASSASNGSDKNGLC